MIYKSLIAGVFIICATGTTLGQSNSMYSDQINRSIKSLSESDIKDLKEGRGWGLARPAELNGVPGPIHLLELSDEIGLTDTQIEKITVIYDAMKAQAMREGELYIHAERALEELFVSKKANEANIRAVIEESEKLRASLRFIHLSAHLEMLDIVNPEQIDLYNKLRGYSDQDPCLTVPEGHNADMWRRHNGCE